MLNSGGLFNFSATLSCAIFPEVLGFLVGNRIFWAGLQISTEF